MTKSYEYAMTHGGRFHADDVFSAALLRMTHPGIKIIRTFEVPDDFDGIVFDIGGGRFDHHQKDAEVRKNGVPYASFGLLWREYGEEIISKGFAPEQASKEAARFDERFIQPLDEDDNTGCGSPMAGAVGTFNPCWDSEESADECFEEAVEFASVILRKRLRSIMSINRAKKLVEEALAQAKNNIVILQRFAPWRMVLLQSDAVFVIYPSQRGGFCAQAIPADSETKDLRCAFPQEWAGNTASDLKRISGIETLTFCHKGCFLISTDNLEDAVAACNLAWNLHTGQNRKNAATQNPAGSRQEVMNLQHDRRPAVLMDKQSAKIRSSAIESGNRKENNDFRMDCWKKLKTDEV